jgi:glycosyltransferase involved in cell wall biosynthesis
MSKIACCAIVKNEEEILRTMLDNVKQLVDEYIIFDTGSTDKTKEIIAEYGEVHETPFVNFVDTKNVVLDYALTKNIDYILWMDADERIYQNINKLREYAEQGVECVSCKITEGPQDDNIVYNKYDRCRLWKNNGKWRFYGPNVHEVICGEGEIVYDDIILVRHEHLKSDKGITARDRFTKYVELLTDYIKEHPQDTRAWFYLARTHKDMNNLLEAIDCYSTYLDIPNNLFRDERWQAYFDGALCWKELGEYDKATVWLNCAIQIDSRRAEAYNLLGLMAFNKQDYEEAIKYYRMAIRDVPEDVRLFLNPLEYDRFPKDQLVLLYYKTKQFDKAEEINKQLIDTLDQRILNNLWWCRTRTQMKIFMTLGLTPEPIYGGMIDKQGVHGVETTYLEMSEEFVKQGHDVFLFCTTEKEHIYKGVYYVPYQNIDEYWNIQPDIIITSRWFDVLYKDNISKKIIWLQDAYFAPPEQPDAFDKADLVVCSSEWHRQYIAQRYGEQIKKEKLRIIPLGIRKNLFVEELEKIPYKCIYSSNPDRGLYILADMWQELTDKIPEINLTVCYGWEGLKTWNKTKEWEESVVKQQEMVMSKLGKFDNIRFTGRIKKSDLAKEFLTSELCLYPNNFWETYCLTALEAQIAGCPLITTDIGALQTTVNSRYNVKIEGNPFGQKYQKKFIEETINLFNDKERLIDWAKNNRLKKMFDRCDWVDIVDMWQKELWRLM